MVGINSLRAVLKSLVSRDAEKTFKNCSTVFSLLLLLCLTASGQVIGNDRVGTRISAQSIGLDETATLTITVKGLNDVVDVPTPVCNPSTGLQIQSIGRQFSMTSINGVSQTSTDFNFLITPLQKGRFVINGVRVNVNGIDYTTRNHRLTVTDALGRTRPAYPPSMHSQIPGMMNGLPGMPRGIPGMSRVLKNRQPQNSDDVMLEAELEPKKVYKHQPTTYTLRLLAAVRLFRDPRYNPISPTGFLSIPYSEQSSSQTTRNGRNYAVTEAKAAFFPLTEGEYTFPGSQVEVNYGGFFGRTQQLSTPPKVVEVLPLPTEDQPDSFTGAVGEEFEIKASLAKRQTKSGQTVELKIEVEGDGHLGLVPYPYLPDWEGVEKRQIDGSTNTKVTAGRVESTRTYKFRLKMKEPGDYLLDGISLAYFRPSLERYEVVKASALNLQVTQGKALVNEAEVGKSASATDGDLPVSKPGRTVPDQTHLPFGFLAASALLAILGLGLSLVGSKGQGGLSFGRGIRLGKPKTLTDLEKYLIRMAPGHDSISRANFLEQQGWTTESISRLESLRTRTAAAKYNSHSGSHSLPELLTELEAVKKGAK